MPGGRFILRYRGAGAAPDGDIDRIRAVPEANVVDQSPRMLLVEGSGDVLQTLVDSMPGWMMSEERLVSLPDPRPKVRRGPGTR